MKVLMNLRMRNARNLRERSERWRAKCMSFEVEHGLRNVANWRQLVQASMMSTSLLDMRCLQLSVGNRDLEEELVISLRVASTLSPVVMMMISLRTTIWTLTRMHSARRKRRSQRDGSSGSRRLRDLLNIGKVGGWTLLRTGGEETKELVRSLTFELMLDVCSVAGWTRPR